MSANDSECPQMNVHFSHKIMFTMYNNNIKPMKAGQAISRLSQFRDTWEIQSNHHQGNVGAGHETMLSYSGGGMKIISIGNNGNEAQCRI
jgi:hypothetical protein